MRFLWLVWWLGFAMLGTGAAGAQTGSEAVLPSPFAGARCGFVTDCTGFEALGLHLGSSGVLAVAQHELVERERWLTPAQFLELLGLGQALPGPNIVNVALMIGLRFHGARGAAAALAGLLLAPLLIALTNFLVIKSIFSQQENHPLAFVMMGAVVVLAWRIKKQRDSSSIVLPPTAALRTMARRNLF